MKVHWGRLFFGVGLIIMMFASSIIIIAPSLGHVLITGMIMAIFFVIMSSTTEW
jgi:hypothetical protein